MNVFVRLAIGTTGMLLTTLLITQGYVVSGRIVAIIAAVFLLTVLFSKED